MAQSARIEELRKRYEENQRRFFAPLANEYRKAGDLEQAIALCQLHLVDAPSNLSGQIVFGQALYDAGNLDESRGAFETAIGLDPENLIALRHLGDIARTQQDVPRAREWYQRVLDADPRNDEVLAVMHELAASTPTEAPPAPAAGAPDRPSQSAPPLIEASGSAAAPMAAPEGPMLVELVEAAVPPAAPEPPVSPGWSDVSPASADAKTIEIVAMPLQPQPADSAPSATTAETLALSTEHEALDFGELDFAQPAPTADPPVTESAPASSFGFDVNLDAAAGLPVADVGMNEETSDFGEVELPRASSFSDVSGEVASHPFAESAAPPLAEPDAAFSLEPSAHEEPVAATPVEHPPAAVVEVDDAIEEGSIVAEVPADLPNIMEYVDELPSLPIVAVPTEAFPEFEVDVPPPRSPTPSDLDAFEFTTGVLHTEEPSAPSFESFDPIREMPTPVAPIAAAAEPTPRVSMPAIEPPSAPDAEPVYESMHESMHEAMREVEVEPEPVHEPIYEPAYEPAVEPISETVQEPAHAAASVDDAVADAPADAPGDAPADAPPPAEVFATETMAELYVRQGLRQEAIAVYTQLVEARPNDTALQGRLRELETRAAKPGSGSTARAFFANLAGRRATPMRAQQAVTPVVTTAVVPESVESPAETAAAVSGGTPRDMLAVSTADSTPEPAAEAFAPAPGGTLDALFGHSDVARPDASAAQSLAAAFAHAPPPISGRPTRAASDEVSLDRVFREGAATPSKGGLAVPRQSSSLRFDQFFAPSADAPVPPSKAPPAEGGGESEQFQAWLAGLKKP